MHVYECLSVHPPAYLFRCQSLSQCVGLLVCHCLRVPSRYLLLDNWLIGMRTGALCLCQHCWFSNLSVQENETSTSINAGLPPDVITHTAQLSPETHDTLETNVLSHNTWIQ